MEIQRVLVSIDDILDTRMGVLACHHPDLAAKITSDAKSLYDYQTRIIDKFGEISVSEFKELYNNRDLRAMACAKPTQLYYELYSFLNQCLDLVKLEPHKVSGIELHINISPYKLTHEQQRAVLISLSDKVPQGIPVELVDVGYKTLSPEYIKRAGYASLFIYDFMQWASHHYNPAVVDGPHLRVPATTFYTPSLWGDLDMLKDVVEFKSPSGEQCKPEEGLQFMFKPYLYLEHTPSGLFSLGSSESMAHHLTKK